MLGRGVRARTQEAAVYMLAASTYVLAGILWKPLLNWLVGPLWVVAAVWLLPGAWRGRPRMRR